MWQEEWEGTKSRGETYKSKVRVIMILNKPLARENERKDVHKYTRMNNNIASRSELLKIERESTQISTRQVSSGVSSLNHS